MPVTVESLHNKRQTGRRMYSLVSRYSGDLDTVKAKNGARAIPLSQFQLLDFFDFVRSLPYRRDNAPIEVVARPRRILEESPRGIDCKKKAILVASWLRANGLPYRFLAVSTRPNKAIHHVYPQVRISGQWLNLDATYANYRPFSVKTVTASEVLPE